MTRVVLALAIAGLVGACEAREGAGRPVETTSAQLPSSPAVHSNALWLADREVAAAPDNAWGHYDRAIALHDLRQTDQAVIAYRQAEARFGDSRYGRSIAIYGRARALDDAGQCDEARTAYGEFAALLESSDPHAADIALSYAQLCRPENPAPRESVTSEVSTAVVAGDYERALALAKRAPKAAEPAPWLDYNRGVALAELGRTTEAVGAFRAAEQGFTTGVGNRRGRSVAIYGRARALDAAGRCAEARAAYEEYAAFVGDRQAADGARAIAGRCDAAP